MSKKILFVISMVEEDFYNLRNVKADIKKDYPEYYYQVEDLLIKERPERLNSLTVSPMILGNVGGRWLAANISTPSKVVDKPLTLEILKEEMAKDTYTHICVSAFVDGYQDLKESMEWLISEHPEVERIVGNVGAMYPQVSQYFDEENVSLGDGIAFLREKLNEPLDQPYHIPSTVGYLEMAGDKNKKMPVGVLTTAIGCPHKCDFCPTAALFKGKYQDMNFTAEDIYNAIKEMEQKIGSNEFLIFIAEPNGFVNKKLWYSVFDYFRDKEGSYGLIAPISMDILSSYDMDRLQNSAIRLEIVNIGLESVNTKTYNKNKSKDRKKQLSIFESYGITIWGTFIIGFPEQTMDDIENEVNGLIELNPTIPALLNLRPIRGTQLFTELEQKGKISSDYLEVGYRFGFMAYEHNHIKKEFSTISKLMLEYYDYIETQTGHSYLRILETKAFQKNTSNLRDMMYVKFLYYNYVQIQNDWLNYFCNSNKSKRDEYILRFEKVKNRLTELGIIEQGGDNFELLSTRTSNKR